MVFFGPIKFELIDDLLMCLATNNHSSFFKSISFEKSNTFPHLVSLTMFEVSLFFDEKVIIGILYDR